MNAIEAHQHYQYQNLVYSQWPKPKSEIKYKKNCRILYTNMGGSNSGVVVKAGIDSILDQLESGSEPS